MVADQSMIGDQAGAGILALIEHREEVEAEATLARVFERLHGHPWEYVAVVEGRMLKGLVSRSQIGFVLGSRFGHALHGKDLVRQHLLREPLFVPANTPLMSLLEQALSRKGEAFYHDVPVVAADGTFVGIIGVQTLVRLQTGILTEKTKVACEQQAILERKNKQLFQSLTELRQSQGRYQILFHHSPMGVALVNEAGEVETCNSRFESLLGLGEWAGRQGARLPELAVPEDQGRLAELFSNHSENPETPRENEFQLHLKERGLRTFRFQSKFIRETGQICLQADDITEHKLMMRSLAQQEKSALLDSLAGGIAHEINNKLSPILGYAELIQMGLEQKPDVEKMKSFCTTIRDNAFESARIIRQLLQLSKPIQPEMSLCDLRSITQDVLQFLRFRLREVDCEVQTGLPGQEVSILADSGQIKQVLINLLLNAADALEHCERRQIRVAVSSQVTGVVISVKDTGTGIKREHLERIFDPFFTTKGPNRGTGLGLSICATIIRQHGGEIRCWSEVGQGTEFTVSLPHPAAESLSHRNEPGVSEKHARKPDTSMDKMKVLVVHDEEFITGFIQEVLRKQMNCHVERVHSGSQAIPRLERSRFDLVISDVRMPGLDGLGLHAWIKEHRPGLLDRFFFITGDGGAAANQQQEGFPKVPVLRKLFFMEALLRECEKVRGHGR